MTILDKKPESDVSEKHGELIKKARVTKAAGCLLIALATVKEPTVLRSQVQAELKELPDSLRKRV